VLANNVKIWEREVACLMRKEPYLYTYSKRASYVPNRALYTPEKALYNPQRESCILGCDVLVQIVKIREGKMAELIQKESYT